MRGEKVSVFCSNCTIDLNVEEGFRSRSIRYSSSSRYAQLVAFISLQQAKDLRDGLTRLIDDMQAPETKPLPLPRRKPLRYGKK